MSRVQHLVSVLPGSVRLTDGTLVVFVPPDTDGPAGVREPRRPAPPTLPARARVLDTTA